MRYFGLKGMHTATATQISAPYKIQRIRESTKNRLKRINTNIHDNIKKYTK